MMLEFANIWGLLAGLSLPVLLAVYLFRRQPEVRKVSSLFLWKLDRPPDSPGPQLRRLRVDRLLLLQLLALFMLTMAIARPVFRAGGRVVCRRWVVMDLSASMMAVDRQGRSAWAKGVERLGREIVRDGARTQWAWVEAGTERRAGVFMEGGPAAARLAELSPAEDEDRLGEAIAFAEGHAGSSDEIWVVTDHPAERGMNERVARWLAFGESHPNVAWVSAQRRSHVRGERLAASLAVYGAETREIRIGCQAGEEALKEVRIEAGNGCPGWVEMDLPPSWGRKDVVLSLSMAGDALREDDRVIVPPPPDRTVKVELAVEKGPVRTAVERGLGALQGVAVAAPGEAAHLKIEGGIPKERAPVDLTLVLGAVSAKDGTQLSGTIGPYLVERHHPLMEGVELDGVLFGGVHMTRPEGVGQTLVFAGDIPLFYRRETVNEQWVWNADLRRSSLFRSEAWPVFLQNLVERARDRMPGFSRSLYATAEPLEIRPARDWMGRVLKLNGKSWLTLRNPEMRVLPPPGRAGELKVEGTSARACVSLLASPESDLVRLGSGDWGRESGRGAEWRQDRDMTLFCSLAVLVLAGCDWLWLRRRFPRALNQRFRIRDFSGSSGQNPARRWVQPSRQT
ncbi:MAG: BatA domain-containing protein [Verrucomicrobiae bacterium]|nr:BatA domain-containing protein [Verrucomicrobiae bacterium]